MTTIYRIKSKRYSDKYKKRTSIRSYLLLNATRIQSKMQKHCYKILSSRSKTFLPLKMNMLYKEITKKLVRKTNSQFITFKI